MNLLILSQDVPIVIVGTKMDLVSTHPRRSAHTRLHDTQYNEREVTRQAIQELASAWKIPFYETSAKKNWNIQEVFQALTKQMRQRYPEAPPKKRRKKDCIIM